MSAPIVFNVNIQCLKVRRCIEMTHKAVTSLSTLLAVVENILPRRLRIVAIIIKGALYRGISAHVTLCRRCYGNGGGKLLFDPCFLTTRTAQSSATDRHGSTNPQKRGGPDERLQNSFVAHQSTSLGRWNIQYHPITHTFSRLPGHYRSCCQIPAYCLPERPYTIIIRLLPRLRERRESGYSHLVGRGN